MTEDDFFNLVNQTRTVTQVDDIVDSNSVYVSNTTVQKSGHIRGIVDIVGFKQMVCIDGVHYIPGLPEDHAIIKTKLWDEGLHWNNNLDHIKITDERITTANNITTVDVDIHLLWHHSELKSRTVCGLNGCRTHKWIRKTYYDEYATFTASRVSPQQYPGIVDPVCKVTIFNNSIAPKTVVNIPDIDYILGYRIKFINETIEYFYNVLSVEELDNGFEYYNFTRAPSQSIYEDSDIFSRIGNVILINSTEMNGSLNISMITPYDEKEINYTVSNYSSEAGLDGIQLSDIFRILVLVWFIVMLVNHWGRWI